MTCLQYQRQKSFYVNVHKHMTPSTHSTLYVPGWILLAFRHTSKQRRTYKSISFWCLWLSFPFLHWRHSQKGATSVLYLNMRIFGVIFQWKTYSFQLFIWLIKLLSSFFTGVISWMRQLNHIHRHQLKTFCPFLNRAFTANIFLIGEVFPRHQLSLTSSSACLFGAKSHLLTPF